MSGFEKKIYKGTFIQNVNEYDKGDFLTLGSVNTMGYKLNLKTNDRLTTFQVRLIVKAATKYQ